MATASSSSSSSSTRSEPSRLQRKKPASLQINRPCWNVAIPLLSPLITSPTAIDNHHLRTAEIKSREEQHRVVESEKKASASAVVFKKWQHPAAPLCYEPAPFAPSFFVPV
ncbi:uncharacterized protein At4g14450, chloroplastic [Ricinus communis]|uniref:ATBET12, putative n=1 Tax=Ricinus communis TaxID=3988 RepID=B9STJ3_RICCO|nr:uncharacterized protein At4g14450, chloroplastic [Ricinus communis]EEF33081.1 ATBET12, putative [Ricinus communis]|eukprot:XP_002529312.1 uncharacterized protein At4g14450, chloroplastic [Ricinus communis]